MRRFFIFTGKHNFVVRSALRGLPCNFLGQPYGAYPATVGRPYGACPTIISRSALRGLSCYYRSALRGLSGNHIGQPYGAYPNCIEVTVYLFLNFKKLCVLVSDVKLQS